MCQAPVSILTILTGKYFFATGHLLSRSSAIDGLQSINLRGLGWLRCCSRQDSC
jgi:hypothetical protein